VVNSEKFIHIVQYNPTKDEIQSFICNKKFGFFDSLNKGTIIAAAI